MSDTIQSVKDLPEVSFIDNDTLEAMKTRMVANFESEWKRITGQEITLSPSDPNRIMLYAIALELYQDEQYIDRAGKQDLIKYSYGEFLDNLGAGRGVTRKQPSPAETTLRFTLSEKRPAAVGIPEGAKVTDGNPQLLRHSRIRGNPRRGNLCRCEGTLHRERSGRKRTAAGAGQCTG